MTNQAQETKPEPKPKLPEKEIEPEEPKGTLIEKFFSEVKIDSASRIKHPLAIASRGTISELSVLINKKQASQNAFNDFAGYVKIHLDPLIF